MPPSPAMHPGGQLAALLTSQQCRSTTGRRSCGVHKWLAAVACTHRRAYSNCVQRACRANGKQLAGGKHPGLHPGRQIGDADDTLWLSLA